MRGGYISPSPTPQGGWGYSFFGKIKIFFSIDKHLENLIIFIRFF